MNRIGGCPCVVRREWGGRSAFTVIELLIAIALMLVLVGTMFGFVFDLLASRTRALEFSSRQQSASSLIRQLEADVACAVVGDSRLGSGIRGSSTSLRIMTRGVAASLAQRGSADADVFSDSQCAEYQFDKSNKRIAARRWPARLDPDTPPEFAPYGGVISHVRFRYFENGTWQSSFDSVARSRLPEAVEVAMWFDVDAEGLEQIRGPDHDDSSPVFDEFEVAMRSDREARPAPAPDRLRVIMIPDAKMTSDATEGSPP